MGLINNIYNRAVNTNRPARVLCFPYNGHFDMSLLDTGHDFYFVRDMSVHKWPRFNTNNRTNFNIITEEQVGSGFDVILFNDRQAQKSTIDKYVYGLHIPSIIIDHKPVSLNPYLTKEIYKSQPFTSVQCYESDNDTKQILYAVNPQEYEQSQQQEKDIDVLFINNIVEAKVGIVQQILGQYPMKFIGNPLKEAPHLKPQSTETYQEYKDLFRRAKIFIHLPSHLGLSHELIWALNHNCWVLGLSDANTDPSLMAHPCYISATLELTSQIKQLLPKSPSDSPLVYTSNYNKYINDWKELITEHQKKVYHHENNN